MSVVVGSSAAKHWYPDYREPKDLDIWICDEDYVKPTTGLRVEVKDVSEYPNLKDFYYEAVQYGEMCDPNLLYTLKLSHSFWNVKWLKTAEDILFFQSKRLKHSDYYMKAMKKDWEGIHGKKKAYLNKSNEDFFKDNVNRVYQHDTLHQAMAYGDYPWYTKLKKDPSKALMSKEMFDNLEHYQKLQVCFEEIYVTALERFLIPSDFKEKPEVAMRKAIWKLTTSMSSGFFPEFIMIFLSELWYSDKDYVQDFKNGLNNGTIRRVENGYQAVK